MFQVDRLQEIVGASNVIQGEMLSKHTTFRIGGKAKVYATPETVEEFVEAVSYVRKEKQPFFVMGNGSNLLAYDTGYDGVILSTHGNGKKEERKDSSMAIDALMLLEPASLERELYEEYLPKEVETKNVVLAGCGVMLSAMANFVAKNGLDGFAFAGGIPGTLGGAVTMNAGAYGGEIKDCILGAMVLDEMGQQVFLDKEQLQLGYRSSRVQKENLMVLWALFAYEKGDREEIEKTMRELNQKRREKQPLQYGSAGSTFKRPEGYFAGKLIEDAGLKGYRVGDVMVSEKHCGFVVNVGKGTYEEARQVIEHVQKTVMDKFQVSLELEVRMIQ